MQGDFEICILTFSFYTSGLFGLGLMDINTTNADAKSIQGRANIFCNIGRILTSSLIPSEVFQRVMTVVGEYFPPRNWSLLLMEEKTGRFKQSPLLQRTILP